jgi:hypothetical protein
MSRKGPEETPAQKHAREQAIADFRAVMATDAGRRFYVRVLLRCGLWESSFVDSAARTAYQEGRRSIAVELVREGKVFASKDFSRALNEQEAKEQESRALADAE